MHKQQKTTVIAKTNEDKKNFNYFSWCIFIDNFVKDPSLSSVFFWKSINLISLLRNFHSVEICCHRSASINFKFS